MVATGKELESRLFLGGDLPPKDPKMMSDKNQDWKAGSKKVLPLTALAFVLAWLLALTVVRELQLAELRSQVRALREDVDRIKNVVPAQEMIDLENEIDARPEPARKLPLGPLMANPDETNYGRDEGFDDGEPEERTWSEDEYEEDDEDDDVVDDELPPGFLGETSETRLRDGRSPTDEERPPLKKVMRFFEEDGPDDAENEEDDTSEDASTKNRKRRGVIAETIDGVPVLEEPYRVARARNRTGRFYHLKPEQLKEIPDTDALPKMFVGWDAVPQQHHNRRKHKKYDDSTTRGPSVYSRSSRVMSTYDSLNNPMKVIRMRRPQTRSGYTSEDQEDDAAIIERFPSDEESGSRHRNVNFNNNNNPKRRRKMQQQQHRQAQPQMRELQSSRTNYASPESRSLTSAAETRSGQPLANPGVKPLQRPLGDLRKMDMMADAFEPLVAHFSGNSLGSSYVPGVYHDGRTGHEHDVTYTAWSADTLESGKFPMQDGSARVPEDGIYFVYAQVHFHDAHDRSGFDVIRIRGGEYSSVHQMILQCISTSLTHPATHPSLTNRDKNNSCFTAGAFRLQAGDRLTIKNIEGHRYCVMDPGKSFFGLFKLANAV